MASPLARQVAAVRPQTTMEVTFDFCGRSPGSNFFVSLAGLQRTPSRSSPRFFFFRPDQRKTRAAGARSQELFTLSRHRNCAASLEPPFLASAVSIFTLLLQSLRSPETSRSCYKTFCDGLGFFLLLLLFLSLLLRKPVLKKRLSKFYTAIRRPANATPVGLMWQTPFTPTVVQPSCLCLRWGKTGFGRNYTTVQTQQDWVTQACRWTLSHVCCCNAQVVEEQQFGSSVESHFLVEKGSETIINIMKPETKRDLIQCFYVGSVLLLNCNRPNKVKTGLKTLGLVSTCLRRC